MRQLMENIKDFLGRDWTLAEKVLVVLCCVLFGVIQGFLLAPIKKGISCGNNNGSNNYNEYADDFWLDDEE